MFDKRLQKASGNVYSLFGVFLVIFVGDLQN